MLNLDVTTFSAVTEKAMQDAAAHPRWLTAISRAVVECLSNPYMERQTDHPGLLIASPSGSVYAANGQCGCTAFTYGQPCWHRAAARLVRLHDERQAKTEVDADVTARRLAYEQAVREMEELYA
jgi:hypothetical protein